MNVIKSLWASFKKHIWDVIPLWLWVIFILTALALTAWIMGSDLMMWFDGKTDALSIWDMLQLVLFLILTQVIFIVTMHKIYSSDTSEQKKEFSLELMTVACGVLAFMSIIFIWIMPSEYMLQLVSSWLGTKCDRAETLGSIGYGMGGVLAVIGAIALNRRATAQEKNNDDIRFQDMMTGLGDQDSTVRVATFYRFYYLASKKIQTDEFKNNIFEMLCSCLRTMSSELPYAPKEKYEHLTKSQILFDILFKGKFKSNSQQKGLVNDDSKSDLRNVHFVGIDFSDANLSNADFREANFSQGANLAVNLHNVYSLDKADFRGAKIGDISIKKEDLPPQYEKGEYYAEWNPPPKKEED